MLSQTTMTKKQHSKYFIAYFRSILCCCAVFIYGYSVEPILTLGCLRMVHTLCGDCDGLLHPEPTSGQTSFKLTKQLHSYKRVSVQTLGGKKSLYVLKIFCVCSLRLFKVTGNASLKYRNILTQLI